MCKVSERINDRYVKYPNWIRSDLGFGTPLWQLCPLVSLDCSRLSRIWPKWRECASWLNVASNPAAVFEVSKRLSHIADSTRPDGFPLTKSPATFLLLATSWSAESFCKLLKEQCSQKILQLAGVAKLFEIELAKVVGGQVSISLDAF